MPERATRRSVKKSRGGCSRCKSQHLKCDEKKPVCGRCERLGLSCPGYSQAIKWSRKHELAQAHSGADPTNVSSTISLTENGSLPTLPETQDWDWLKFSIPSGTQDTMTDAPISDRQVEETTEPLEQLRDTGDFVWPSAESLFGQSDEAPDYQLALTQARPISSQSLMQSLGVHIADETTPIHQSLVHEPYELISYYFKTVPALYSTFDSHKNPFRSSVSNLFSHSLAVNLAAQSMAAACLVEVHPRFVAIGSRLRREALEAVQNEPNHNYDVLLALSMSGPTGNWFQADDLGISSYHAMRDRLDELAVSAQTDKRVVFFQEAMVLWELFLAYVNPSVLRPSIPLPPMMRNEITQKYETHSWNGIARDTLQIVRDIGRLVRGNRLRSLNQKFVSQAYILQQSADLSMARDLEQQLLSIRNPMESEVEPTEDRATPIWHLTTMAELFRYVGLLQIYRCFPDLLSNRLKHESGLSNDASIEDCTEIAGGARDKWLTAFALEGLHMLESINLESGTKDFQPFLLVALASELVCRDDQSSYDLIVAKQTPDTTIGNTFAQVAMMRKFVLDRLTSFLHVIPPKPIRICLDIVRETWRRMDEGQENVYWLDVMIENGWETIMA